MISIRWHGRGGQGCFTAARLLGMAASLYAGKYALAFPSFGPERRGAPVLAFTKIADEPILDRSETKECDYIVVLDDTLMGDGVAAGLKTAGVLLVNSPGGDLLVSGSPDLRKVDATALALEVLGRPITNTAMLGALMAVMKVPGITLETVGRAVDSQMSPAVRAANRELLQRAYSETIRAVSV